MNIPPKAIIEIKSQEEYEELNSFFETYTGRHMKGVYLNGICCDLDPGVSYITAGSKSNYENWIKGHDLNKEIHSEFVPDEDYLRFISVPDFIAICKADELESDFEIETGNLDEIL